MKRILVILTAGFIIQISGYTISAQTMFFTGTTDGESIESIALCELDEDAETIKVITTFKGGERPGYLALGDEVLYTVSSTPQTADQHTLRAFRISQGGHKLDMISEVSSKGLGPCHVAVDRDGKSLYTANYGSGSVAQYSINPNGSLGGNQFFEQFSGSSVNQRRQKGPHAHYINATIDNKYILTADLGTDKVMIHTLDDSGKMQVNQNQPYVDLPLGSGPRHLEFHPNNQWIYVLNELNSTISLLQYVNGRFTLKQTISTLPDEFDGTSYSAAVRLHPNGRYVYSSNRGSDSISVFEIDDSGQLKRVQTFGEGLGWVRDFNVSPSGKFILAGNEKTDLVVLLKLDRHGTIEKQVTSLELPNPSCFVFYPQNK